MRWSVITDPNNYRTGQLFFTVSGIDTGAGDHVGAWYLYKMRYYNKGYGTSLVDSGGNTGSFSISFSDQGDSANYGNTMILDLSVSSVSGDGSIMLHTTMSNSYGIYESWRETS